MSARLPALDPYLASIGEEVEDLSRVAAAQPFRSAGPVVDRAALETFASARKRVKGAVPPALVAAELVDDDGVLTEPGRTVHAFLHDPKGRVRVESGRGHAPLSLDVYLARGRALVVATAAPGSFAQAPRGDAIVEVGTTVTLDLVDATAVPAMIAAWVGLQPAWSLRTSPVDLPEALLMHRVDDPRAPLPEGADGNLRHVWAQPWFLWTLRSSGAATGLVMVNAGRSGHYALTTPSAGAPEGSAGFHPVPATHVWTLLAETLATTRG